ncbi:MAG: membrane protein [Maribacter sp.]
MSVEKEGKTTAIVAYFTIVGSLIAFSMNAESKNEFARFHTRQAFGLHLFFLGFALFLSQWFNEYAWIGLYVCYIVLWGYGFIGALTEKRQSVPILGPYFQKWFTFIQ